MKKRTALFLTLCLVLSLSACGSSNNQSAANTTTPTAPSTQQTPAEPAPTPQEPAPAPEQTTPEAPPAEEEPAADTDFLDAVIDPAAAEGKLNMYFISTTESFGEGSDYIYAGDSTLLISPDGKVMLIDMSNLVSGDEVLSFVQSLGIDTIDYLVNSHPHADHLGGHPDILSNLTIKQLYKNAHAYGTRSYNSMMETVSQLKIPTTVLKAGDSFLFGDSIQVEILNPPEDYVFSSETEQTNNGSLLMKFTYGESTILFGGDLYAKQEELLVEQLGEQLDVDVVKMNHHGDSTSNTKEWVNAVSAKIAVAEANGVRSDLVGNRFRLGGGVALYTSMDGHLVIRTTGDGTYEVQTQYERDVPLYDVLDSTDGYMLIQ